MACLVCCARVHLPTAGPARSPAGLARPGTACAAHVRPAAALRLRGGRVERGAVDAGGSAAVSDGGLLRPQSEQTASWDGDMDMSVLEEWRASKLRQLRAVEEAGFRSLLESKTNEDELTRLLQEQDTKVPEVPTIDYGAEMGIDVQRVRARAREAGDRDGTCLRECDEALLREEDEAYAAALRKDNTLDDDEQHADPILQR